MSFWKNKSVFVTGATGLLGSWLVQDLVTGGAKVVALLRDWIPDSRLVTSQILEKVNVVRGDLEDLPVLVRALNEYEIDSIFHLGAQTIVGTASRSTISTFESNIKGTWNVLEAAKQCGTKIERVLIASSDKAYGAHEKLPYTEETPLQGRFPYDVSKSCGDLLSFSYFYTYRTPIAVTRCGNLYGGGDLNFNRLVPGTIRSALNDEAPIIRSDGHFIRDYFYVRDAVTAYLQLAEKLPGQGFVGEAFNFGNEKPISVLELVDQILMLMGKQQLQPNILNQASFEIKEQYLDCSKARERLQWSAKFTLEQGLRETIDWYRSHLK